jgi:Ubiquitin-conjugating enzyme
MYVCVDLCATIILYSGVFVFDIYLPPQYPDIPLECVHITPEASRLKAPNGPGGFSPNLHSDSGKVCLSLLGTWQGPGWVAKQSNIYQVLSSIQLMILGAPHPYYMEPGYGGRRTSYLMTSYLMTSYLMTSYLMTTIRRRLAVIRVRCLYDAFVLNMFYLSLRLLGIGWEGTMPAVVENDRTNYAASLRYEEDIKFNTAELAILRPLKNPPKGFEKVVQAHFVSKRYEDNRCTVFRRGRRQVYHV